MLKPKYSLKNLEYLESLGLPETLKSEVKRHALKECKGDCKLSILRLLKLSVFTMESS